MNINLLYMDDTLHVIIHIKTESSYKTKSEMTNQA